MQHRGQASMDVDIRAIPTLNVVVRGKNALEMGLGD